MILPLADAAIADIFYPTKNATNLTGLGSPLIRQDLTLWNGGVLVHNKLSNFSGSPQAAGPSPTPSGRFDTQAQLTSWTTQTHAQTVARIAAPASSTHWLRLRLRCLPNHKATSAGASPLPDAAHDAPSANPASHACMGLRLTTCWTDIKTHGACATTQTSSRPVCFARIPVVVFRLHSSPVPADRCPHPIPCLASTAHRADVRPSVEFHPFDAPIQSAHTPLRNPFPKHSGRPM